jgi:hypothetical protein
MPKLNFHPGISVKFATAKVAKAARSTTGQAQASQQPDPTRVVQERPSGRGPPSGFRRTEDKGFRPDWRSKPAIASNDDDRICHQSHEER